MAALRGTSGLGLLLSCIILVAFAFLWYFFSFSKGVNPCIVLCPLFPSCSLTGVCLKDIKTHSNALPPNTQNFPVQNHLMANPAPQMPLRGTQNAPKFDGKTPALLPRFFEDVDILGTVAGIMDLEKIRATIRYADLEEAKDWELLNEVAANPPDWANLTWAVKKLYPGCEGAN